MRTVLVLVVLAIATPAVAQQPEQVVTPTYTHDRACYQSVPCEVPPPPCPTTYPAPTPCQPVAGVIHYEMRSKAIFWGGAVTAAGGAALVVGAFTWGRESVVVGYPTAPCGVDPYVTRLPIAPCQTSSSLLAAGLSLASAGGLMMFYGGQHVAVGADGRTVKVTVKF